MFIFAVLFYLLVSFPHAFVELKLLLLILCLSVMLMKMAKDKSIKMDPSIFKLLVFYTFIGIMYTLYGLANNNEGAIQMFKIFVLWPIIYTFASIVVNKNHIVNINSILLYGSMTIAITQIVYMLNSINIIPDNILIHIYDKYVFHYQTNFITTYFVPHSSYIFIIPYFTAQIIVRNSLRIASSKYYYGALLVMWIIAITSGRLSLLFVSILSPLLTIGILQYVRISQFKLTRLLYYIGSAIGAGALLIIGLKYLNYDINNLIKYIVWKGDIQNNITMSVRQLQLESILVAIKNNYLLGVGLGGAANYTRDSSITWAYELQYLIYTLWMGLVGIALYFSGILWIIFNLLKIKIDTNSQYILPSAVGFISAIIANSVNPYLPTFEFMWAFFIPIYFINIYSYSEK